ncbi:hypothetical protein [Subtercola sp. RTI3]|uniref:hypothetical protein n=1 Tax=Subtercola sp. RTI3 TaxID=3048639 RepID=UPI002B232FFA|nr:hypothetical protein [Subtercola sp. RTI3]MEA9986254.1 hypothetical protein [Subtercola sp. RTI3]
MTDKPQENIEEQSKNEIAKNVVTAKRRYFLPHHGVSIEAETPEEAVAEYNKTISEKAGE